MIRSEGDNVFAIKSSRRVRIAVALARRVGIGGGMTSDGISSDIVFNGDGCEQLKGGEVLRTAEDCVEVLEPFFFI